MNKKSAIFISLVLSLFVSVLFWFIEHNSAKKFVEKERKNLQRTYSTQFEQIANAVRNDLLQNNIHYARNGLGKAMGLSSLEAYSIVNSEGKIVDKSQNYDSSKTSKEIFPIKIPIYFSSEEQLWGEIEFLGSMKEINQMSHDLERGLLERSLLMLLILFISTVSLMALFWATSSLLSRVLIEEIDGRNKQGLPAILLFIWGPLIKEVKLRAIDFFAAKNKLSEMQKSLELSHIAKQVAHDIRSPVSALKVVLQSHASEQEKSRLIAGAVERIEGIAQELLKKYKDEGVKLDQENCCLKVACLQILEEKRYEYKRYEVKLQFESSLNEDQTYVKAPSEKLKRVLSNLINNAVEANNFRGCVRIALDRAGEFLCLSIIDSGPGLNEETLLLAELGPVKSSKSEGSGLGLHDAITTFKSWNTNISFSSEVAGGTKIEILFPASSWANFN